VVTTATAGPAEIQAAGTLQLKATAEFANGVSSDVTSTAVWRSSDPSLAVVSPGGLVQGGKSGQVEVSAAVDAVVGAVQLNVLPPGGSCRDSMLPASGVTLDARKNFFHLGVSTPREDCRWTAKSDVPWLARSNGSQIFEPLRSGNGSIEVYVDANYSLSARSGRVTVSFTDGTTLTYEVRQREAHCLYSVSPASQSFGSTGGTGTFEVTATPSSCAWKAHREHDYYDPAWQFRAAGNGVGSGTATFGVTPSFVHTYAISFKVLVDGPDPADPPAIFTASLAATGQ
jgi:hypothetical protein